jgi:hypothetical protein
VHAYSLRIELFLRWFGQNARRDAQGELNNDARTLRSRISNC